MNRFEAINSIDFNKEASQRVKGIAILLMIAHHLFTQNVFSQISSVPLSLYYQQIGIMGKLCVSIYMFVGGYAFLLSKENSIIKRLCHIYKKYIITFFITTIILFLTSKLYVTPIQYIQNALCISWEINGSWWFISTYMLCIISFTFFYQTILQINRYLQIVILTICLLVLQPLAGWVQTIQGINPTLQNQLHYFLYYVGFFYLGVIFYQNKLFSYIHSNAKTILLLTIMMLGLLGVRIVFKLHLINFAIVPVFVALACFISKKESVLKFLGRYSMSMWLVHMFFIEKKYFLLQIAICESPLGLFFVVVLLSLGYAILESLLISSIGGIIRLNKYHR